MPIEPRHLLDLARRLIGPAPGAVEADLRRGISTAYYALFHLLILRSAHLTRVFSEFPSSHQYDCVDGMWQRNDVCRNAKRGALNSRHARLPNLTLRYRAGSAVVHLTTTPRLVPSHPSPRVKSYHGVLVRAPRTSRILQLAGLDVSVLERKPQKVSPRQTHAHSAATS